MKYVQPYGIDDPDAHYINGDPSQARMGSIPPAEAFEHPMRELISIIQNSALVPDSDDLEQVAKGIRSQRMNYCEDTGSVNTLSVALDPPLTSYTLGLPLHVRILNTNTGPSTIDAGAGRVPIRRPSGAEMAATDLPAAGIAFLIYDGTVFQMVNFGGAGGGPGAVYQINIPYAVDTSPTPNTVIANFTPPIGNYSAGLIIMVKIANTNNSFSNINCNGLGLKPIYAQGGHPNWPLLPGDIQVGDTIVLIFDGTAFWVYPNAIINIGAVFNVSTVAQFDQLFVALGRKRISTSGAVTIQLAAGAYGPFPGAFGPCVLTTYHADADRIMIQGTMKPGQTPPLTGHFQRTGYPAANRSNDALFNLSMLRDRYATEIRLPTTPAVGMQHNGPGAIVYKNILIVGPYITQYGQRGVSAPASTVICSGVCVWGSADVGFAAGGGAAFLYAINCHATASGSRGYSASGGGVLSISGGGAYSNNTHGMEAAHGGSITTSATDAGINDQYGTLINGFQSSCNGGAGASSESGTIMCYRATIVVNAGPDMYSWDMGVGKQFLCQVGTMSPAPNTEGNLNAISVNYGT